jgi:hypothetical protein
VALTGDTSATVDAVDAHNNYDHKSKRNKFSNSFPALVEK